MAVQLESDYDSCLLPESITHLSQTFCSLPLVIPFNHFFKVSHPEHPFPGYIISLVPSVK